MTKCIVLGEDNSVQPAKKPIEFVLYINDEKAVNATRRATKPHNRPSDFGYIELVQKAEDSFNYDIMYAYESDRNNGGCLYLGHWNDGVVE